MSQRTPFDTSSKVDGSAREILSLSQPTDSHNSNPSKFHDFIRDPHRLNRILAKFDTPTRTITTPEDRHTDHPRRELNVWLAETIRNFEVAYELARKWR